MAEVTGPPTPGLHWVEIGQDCLRLRVDTQLYQEEAIFRTCYIFTDRCYLFLRSEAPNELIVEFRLKKHAADLGRIVGDFGNELIDQRVRLELSRETRAIRELIVTQAFSEADFDAGP